MLFAATFLVNAGLNFLLNLLVAAVLAPAEFGRYALAAAVSVLVNGLAFTWFAMSAARFTSARVDAEEPAVRATLDGSLMALAGGTLLIAGLVALAWPDAGLPAGLLALALCVGVLHGVFDYACALARARFLDRVYARIVIVKNIAAFTTMLGAAWLFRDPHAVLAALGLSILASLLPVRRRLARSGAATFEAARLKRYAAYAAPLVIAVVLYQAIPFLSRSLLSARYGFAETGQFSLAFDTLYRVFAAVGASLEFILFQIAVRTEEQHGRDAAERRVGENVVLVTAALLPAAVGVWLVLPSLVPLFIPPAFREGFTAYAVLLLPATLAQCLITSALNAVFQLRERTAPLVAAAVVALLIGVLLALILPTRFGPGGFALAQSGAMLAALAVTLWLAAPVLRRVVSSRDLAWVGAGCAAMTGVLWPWRGLLPPAIELPLAMVVGALAYAALLFVGNVGGVRENRLTLFRLPNWGKA